MIELCAGPRPATLAAARRLLDRVEGADRVG
jgi:hypothetical protein